MAVGLCFSGIRSFMVSRTLEFWPGWENRVRLPVLKLWPRTYGGLLWKASLTFPTTFGFVICWLPVALVCQESWISWIISFIMSRVMLVISCLVTASSSWNSLLSSAFDVAASCSLIASGSLNSDKMSESSVALGSSAGLGAPLGVKLVARYLGLFRRRCLMESSWIACGSSMLVELLWRPGFDRWTLYKNSGSHRCHQNVTVTWPFNLW